MVVLSKQLSQLDNYWFKSRSLLGKLTTDTRLVSFSQKLSQESTWRNASAINQWSLGRLLLAVGDTETAQIVLHSLPQSALTNTFVYLDVLQSLPPEKAVNLYNTVPPIGAFKAISDTVALAYLDKGQSEDLSKVLLFRPKDLYANYVLWKDNLKYGYLYGERYLQNLQNFDEESLTVTHPKLLAYITETIPLLLIDNVWDTETTQATVSYLVWKYHAFLDVEQLLKALIATYPEIPEWRFLLGELHERNGNIAYAEYMYFDTLRVAGAYLPAIRRLGFLLEIRSQSALDKTMLLQAQALLEDYLSLKFDDVVALRSLVAIYERLQPSRVESLRKRLNQLLDNKDYVANVLGVSVDEIEIGANLLFNSNLLKWVQNRPANFIYNVYKGSDSTNGAFAGGHDGLEFNSMRLLTLRINEIAYSSLPYAEYISSKIMIGPQSYLVMAEYCMLGFSVGYPLLYVGQYNSNGGVTLLHAPLPQLNSGCGLARFIVNGPPVPLEVILLVRNWGKGDLQILNLTVQELTLLDH
ncbi:MAG: hypothetical protein R3E79_42485 [Caldilineaceae bacterium]